MHPFDSMASEWDTPRRIARAEVIAKEIDTACSQGRHQTALEFGCGTGLISMLLRDTFDSICLMDTSEGMIHTLGEKLAALPSEIAARMNPIAHDLTCAPYPGRFDCIYTSMVLHHIADVGPLLQRLYAMLTDGGTLCVVDLDEDDGTFHRLEEGFCGHDGFAHSDMMTYFSRAGFSQTAIHTFYQGEKIIAGRPVPYSLFLAHARRNG